MTRARYGDQRGCELCGSDIEFHGKRSRTTTRGGISLVVGGWTDRGGSGFCDESGAARYDEDGIRIPYPHKLHKPAKGAQ